MAPDPLARTSTARMFGAAALFFFFFFSFFFLIAQLREILFSNSPAHRSPTRALSDLQTPQLHATNLPRKWSSAKGS